MCDILQTFPARWMRHHRIGEMAPGVCPFRIFPRQPAGASRVLVCHRMWCHRRPPGLRMPIHCVGAAPPAPTAPGKSGAPPAAPASHGGAATRALPPRGSPAGAPRTCHWHGPPASASAAGERPPTRPGRQPGGTGASGCQTRCHGSGVRWARACGPPLGSVPARVRCPSPRLPCPCCPRQPPTAPPVAPGRCPAGGPAPAARATA